MNDTVRLASSLLLVERLLFKEGICKPSCDKQAEKQGQEEVPS